MNEYDNLLQHCREIGDTVLENNFRPIAEVTHSMGISANMFAIKFSDLPGFNHVDLQDPQSWGNAALCKSQGIGFIRMNDYTRERLNQYLNSQIF
ncbi:hypothetical protein [Ligilactobacillus pobuzihii]|uniref:Uncharacterized protein n=1 Tax=Ligilactobacillus pobuzihii TaxID=449659 RepID=A0A0R2L1F5_9LACO|nr:hypothetical protein [Ligilactobacillus pobuzihii]KRK09985.1 hypothetical protein FD11_GL000397 [Ligilactobacillus pobuzihii E100301 = KCTC 13174]KRN95595.1 hypothetical protein IV66_GL001039 [Ligilactobacillus pobuzihii]GEN47987.1 hypothetical protein LPO01_07790 [Ligilactobacillus pobuzihii]